MGPSYLLSLAVALAGQAFATVNVTVGSQTMAASDLINFQGPSQTLVNSANCTSVCGATTQQFNSCKDDSCVCTNTTGMALLNCEQCLFNFVINQNIRPSDSLIGSQPALNAFVAGCGANPHNTTIQALKMTLPPSWEGPESNKLGLGATIVAVGAGAILGGGALFIFSTIE